MFPLLTNLTRDKGTNIVTTSTLDTSKDHMSKMSYPYEFTVISYMKRKLLFNYLISNLLCALGAKSLGMLYCLADTLQSGVVSTNWMKQ